MRAGTYRHWRSTPGFGRSRLARSRDSGWGCRCSCSFIWSGSPTMCSPFMATGESFPGSSRICCAIPGCPASPPWPRPFCLSESVCTPRSSFCSSGYAGSLLSLALGCSTRLSAFLAWALHLSLMTSGAASFYGVDQLANTFLFYLFLFPSGRAWTFAYRSASSRREETIPVGCLRVMQFHLCVIYLGRRFG